MENQMKMSKEIRDLDKELRSPSYDKGTLLEKFKRGISDPIVHTLSQPELAPLSIKMLYCLREFSNMLSKIDLVRPKIETDEDLILNTDRSSHILKIAKALLEPSELNINLVKRALDQLDIDNEYIQKRDAGVSLDLYLREVDKSIDFKLYETSGGSNIPLIQKTLQEEIDEIKPNPEIPVTATEAPKESDGSGESVLTELDNLIKSDMGEKADIEDSKKPEDLSNDELDKSINEKIEKADIEDTEIRLTDEEGARYFSKDEDENMKEKDQDPILKPSGAKWGKNPNNKENDYSAIKEEEDPDKKDEKKKKPKKNMFDQMNDFQKL